MAGPRETYSSFGPECPYCEHSHGDLEPYLYDENTSELTCEHCQETFDMEVSTSTTWTCIPRPSLTPEPQS